MKTDSFSISNHNSLFAAKSKRKVSKLKYVPKPFIFDEPHRNTRESPNNACCGTTLGCCSLRSLTPFVEKSNLPRDLSSPSPYTISESCNLDGPRFSPLELHQSLLVKIFTATLSLHLISTFIKGMRCYDTDHMRELLPHLFETVGHVSRRFFGTLLLSTKAFLETQTFFLMKKGLNDNKYFIEEGLMYNFFSFTSYFDAEVHSIVLEVEPSKLVTSPDNCHILGIARFDRNFVSDFDFLHPTSPLYLPCISSLISSFGVDDAD
ncbi:hypothetical protein GEMRC1_008258 [Eukaryota sp. GEM-RC1]